jgi:branched-chain amino acid transport system ATP-binding protein
MLEVEGIHTFYGLSHILFGISLRVGQGQVVSLLGRNGAGKTTTMKSIIGLAPPKRGNIRFKDEEIVGKQNLEIAARVGRGREGWDMKKVYELFPTLKDIESRKGGFLSGGEQKMLAIARALMGNPELLLLDEPTEGLAPTLVHALEEQVVKLKEAGLTVLLAEQNVRSALRLSDHGYIIDNGQIRYQGSVEELEENEEVRKRYLLV